MIKLIIVITIYFNAGPTGAGVAVSQLESLYEDRAACEVAREHYASEEFNTKMTKKSSTNSTATVIVDATCWNESTADGKARSKKPY